MLGELSRTQAEQLLATENLGRIRCERGGCTFVLPVAYEYRGAELLVRGRPWRWHPEEGGERVCFEVDRVESSSRWQTVMAWGTCEEVGHADVAPPPSADATSALRIRLSSLRGFSHEG